MNKFTTTILAAGIALAGASVFAQSGQAAPGVKPGNFGSGMPATSQETGKDPAKVATPMTAASKAPAGNSAPDLTKQKAGDLGAKMPVDSSMTAGNPKKVKEAVPMGATTGASTNTVDSKAGAFGAKSGRDPQDTGVMTKDKMKK